LFRIFITNCIAPLILLCVACAAPSALGADATLLIQDSRITGPQNVYITPKALRIDNQKTGTTLVCKAPKWELDIYNKRNRTSYHCAAEAFKASFFNTLTKLYREALTPVKWKKTGVETRQGLEILKFGVRLDMKHSHLDLMRGDVRSAEYYVCPGLKLPDKACNVLATLYSMPLFGDVPISCTFYGDRGETLYALSTKDVKKISVVDPFFDLPKFTAAKSEREVFIDPKAQEAMEEMFGEPPSP